MFCYHASKIDVYDVGHLVVQVSGAADHIGEDLLLKTGDEKAETFFEEALEDHHHFALSFF